MNKIEKILAAIVVAFIIYGLIMVGKTATAQKEAKENGPTTTALTSVKYLIPESGVDLVIRYHDNGIAKCFEFNILNEETGKTYFRQVDGHGDIKYDVADDEYGYVEYYLNTYEYIVNGHTETKKEYSYVFHVHKNGVFKDKKGGK